MSWGVPEKFSEAIALLRKEGPPILEQRIKEAASDYDRKILEKHLASVKEHQENEDISTEDEKLLGIIIHKTHGEDLYIIDKFPKEVRPFYTMPDPTDEKWTNAYDVFLRGEEITSGAQRIHDPQMLTEKAKAWGVPPASIQSYIDAFKYGSYPHAGAGIGMERVVMLFLNLNNIRKTSMLGPQSTCRKLGIQSLILGGHGLCSLTMSPWTRAPWALAVGALAVPVEDGTVLSVFQHAPGLRCRTRMFSAPTNPPEEMAIMERVQQSAHWCARHPGCFGVQIYDGGDLEPGRRCPLGLAFYGRRRQIEGLTDGADMGYCLKWCGRPQWCLSPILDADGALTDELVKDELFYLFVKPPHQSLEMKIPTGQPTLQRTAEIPARCSYAGHVVPCFDPLTSCKHHDFRSDGPRASRAFVFADDLQRPAEWLNHLEECCGYMGLVDVVLLLPAAAIARHPISSQQRQALQASGVRLHEVPWIRPELGPGIPRWAQEFWCVDRDFFKLHALGLEYEAAVFNCAHQGYFLASALHGGFEALTIAFFALRPSAALLRAVQRFLLNSTFDDDLAWNSMGYGPWGCLDGTDQWCFHCYHVGGECGQGLFYNLFYQADPVFWSALAAEPGAVRPMGVMVDGCRWLHENSVRVRGFPTVPGPCGDFVEEGKCQDIVAYHKVPSRSQAPNAMRCQAEQLKKLCRKPQKTSAEKRFAWGVATSLRKLFVVCDSRVPAACQALADEQNILGRIVFKSRNAHRRHRHHSYLAATFKALDVLLRNVDSLELKKLAALLEWVNALGVVRQPVRSIRDLADGEILLSVMRDINPEDFSATDDDALGLLRRGLERRFRKGVAQTRSTLQLGELVIWATLDNDFPKRTKYVQICQDLSSSSAQQIMHLAERFSEEPGDTPNPETPDAGRVSSPFGSIAGPRPSELPDFLEVGLDAETRFRRLKEHYIAVKEDQERWEDERQKLLSDLEVERNKRVEAQELRRKERLARAELRVAEEAQDRLREEQRAVLEMKLDEEISSRQGELRQKDLELERLREELELLKCQVWKREKEELRKQLDEISSSNKAGSGTMEHLHGRLAQLRDDVAQVSLQRDQAQMQVKLLQKELENSASRAGAAAGAPSSAPSAAPAPAPVLAMPLAGQLPSEEREKLLAANRELQSQVALRERELQVFNWRSQAESDTLKAQETLMASCFHELGLRYHQLQVQHAQLLKRLRHGQDET
eukprot:s3_g55.t1